MPCNERLVERIRAVLIGLPGADERRMFGGVCFTVHGHMVCGVAGDELMARVGPAGYADALAMPHVREMDFTGKPLRGYVFVAPAGLRSAAALRRWVERGVDFVATLPAKNPARPRPRVRA
jgi:TfoX/Sxy family transcriptional regulator of competence genes